jgi:hypothetical protein
LSVRLAPHALALTGLGLVAFLAFARAVPWLGHHSDSWAYMAEIRQWGPFGILGPQPSRIALPFAWAVGFALAGPSPWIYNALSVLFVGGAAGCLYLLLIAVQPGAYLFAYAAATLSILWPSDPTRYDPATLGNRQAAFLFLLGCLAWTTALERYSGRRLVVAGAAVALSLLTYEAHLLLVMGAALFALLARRDNLARHRLAFVSAFVAPICIWLVATLATVILAPGHVTYQTELSSSLDPSHVGMQMLQGLHVLLFESWQLPLDLLARQAVPGVEVVIGGAVLTVLFMLALVPFGPGLPEASTSRKLCLGALVSAILALGVFAATRVPMSQPDRTQTFSMAPAAIAFCAVASLICLLPQRGCRPGARARLGFALACCPLVFLFGAMGSVYQRNYTQTWREQSGVLRAILAQAPDVVDGTLVVIAGLPDSRIVFVSGYSCEFALAFLERHPFEVLDLRIDPSQVASIVGGRINCGLAFDGRALDFQNRIQFEAEGVSDHFRGVDYLFPYDRLVLFAYQAPGTVSLLDHIPPEMLPDGADASGYRPESLIVSHAPPTDATRVLDDPFPSGG